MGYQEELWLKMKCNTPEGPYLVPFAPNTNWRKAVIFIVGLNPIASLRNEFESFDHYWSALTRYPDVYYKNYRLTNLHGKEKRSRTSKRIAELVEYLHPINVLVTNVFAYPTTNPSLIPKDIRSEPIEERILSKLLELCKPKAVFFHGVEARQFGEQYFKVKLNPYVAPSKQNSVGRIPNNGEVLSLFAYHHLVGRVEPQKVVDVHLKAFASRLRHFVELSAAVVS